MKVMDKLREQLIEAIKYKDTQKLLKLKEDLCMQAFVDKYKREDGTVDIPIKAWIEDLPEIAKKFGVDPFLTFV